VSVALRIQHAERMPHIAICGPPGSPVFFFLHYLINGMIFGVGGGNTEHKFYNSACNISHSKKDSPACKLLFASLYYPRKLALTSDFFPSLSKFNKTFNFFCIYHQIDAHLLYSVIYVLH
jgi:hypothetical protein